jgi:four helix bundle protein
MNEFEHERLDVYQAAVQFLALSDTIAGSLPRGRAYLADQLRRAATSISLNIAEGAGEFAPADKARFYRMARRSATESAAILDACRILVLADNSTLQDGRTLLLRVGLGLGLSTARPIKTYQDSERERRHAGSARVGGHRHDRLDVCGGRSL